MTITTALILTILSLFAGAVIMELVRSAKNHRTLTPGEQKQIAADELTLSEIRRRVTARKNAPISQEEINAIEKSSRNFAAYATDRALAEHLTNLLRRNATGTKP